MRERWLVVLLAAFVPMGIALNLPLELRAPLVAVSLILAAVGLVMLARRPGGSTAGDWYDDRYDDRYTDRWPPAPEPASAPANAAVVVDVPSRHAGSGPAPSADPDETGARVLA